MTIASVRVSLPFHLQKLAGTGAEVVLEVPEPVTADAILNCLEARFPMLCGTIRDHSTHRRRPFLRYFACQRDLSQDSVHAVLPTAISNGAEPFIIWGALAGG